MDAIEVRLTGRGVVVGEDVRTDAEIKADCGLCGRSVEAVASVAAPGAADAYACPDCLRARLDALSVARWRLRSDTEGHLPWGKVTS